MEKIARPKVLKGVTPRITTGCGNLYITVNRDEKTNNVLEVFATLGKSGSCARCQCEGLTRIITLGLRCGVPDSFWLNECIKQLMDIKCSTPGDYYGENGTKKRVESCPDAIAQVLKEELERDKPPSKDKS